MKTFNKLLTFTKYLLTAAFNEHTLQPGTLPNALLTSGVGKSVSSYKGGKQVNRLVRGQAAGKW